MRNQLFKLFLLSSLLMGGSLIEGAAPESGLLEDSKPLPAGGILKRVEIPEIKATILHLKNGMKVALKKTAGDDEMVVRLTALGGYASLPESQWASGHIVAEASIRSGIGSYYFDQLHALLFDQSIEFDAEILPFSRYVEGTAAMGEMDTLMGLIHSFFTGHNLTEHSFKRVAEKTKEQLANRSKNSTRVFEDAYIEFNNPKVSALRPFSIQAIERADFHAGLKALENAFSDPSEFSCVITGSFDTDKMVAIIEKQLASIPAPSNHKSLYALPKLPEPDAGVRTKVVKNPRSSSDSLTTVTLPLREKITEKNFNRVENIAILLHRRLKHVLRERYGNNSVIISVTPEYPLYPCLSSPCIKIQYFSDPKHVTAMGQTILAELQKMQKEGVAKDEVEVMSRKSKKAALLHEADNSYWLMALSNYLSWGWDPIAMPDDLKPLEDPEQIKKILETYFSLENYTIISSQS